MYTMMWIVWGFEYIRTEKNTPNRGQVELFEQGQ